ncbi:hypothetical protein ACF1FC_30130 [Streptomyces sp. NPDC014344]|uniref:hypothetical protein n=1 Tax=Streptomyces sp. NPDC014344 TaxID=3364871 RepID=UPI0036F7FAEF
MSAPWLQAGTLEAARIQPGHRVLETGSGGHDAALPAELAGPAGHVTTPDIDTAVTERALRFLPEAGYGTVPLDIDRGEYLLRLRDCFPGQIREPGMWSLLGGGREPQDAALEHAVRSDSVRSTARDSGSSPAASWEIRMAPMRSTVSLRPGSKVEPGRSLM